jgi:peptide/nickel transport system substrate-binding protein
MFKILRCAPPFLLVSTLSWFCIPGLLQAQNAPENVLVLRDVSGAAGGNLVVALANDPASFNRLFSTGVANTLITDRMSADLVHINRLTFEVEPSLAKSWEPQPDGRSYLVRLRRGLKFSDGSPFTADDVMFTFQVIADPEAAVPLADQVKVDGEFPAVTKIDDYTVKFSYRRPVGMGLRSLDSVPIVPRSRLLKAYQQKAIAAAWGPATVPGDVVGLGPFRLRDYQRGVKVVLEKNPYYWKRDKASQPLPYLDTITFLVLPDRNAEALRFQAGELDLVNALNPENYAALRRNQNSGYTVRDLGPGISFDFLWFNLNTGTGPNNKPWIDPEKRALFEKAEFRRAVSHAINRAGISRSVLLGLATPQYGPVSPGNSVWYDKQLPATEYSPQKARELLAKAGLVDRNGDGVLEFGASARPLEIVLLTARGNAVREKTAQILQNDLAAAGIRLTVQTLLPNEIAARFLGSFDYEAILFGFTTTDVAPDSQSDMWYSSGSFHLWHPHQKKTSRAWEAEMDTLTAELVRSLDPAARIRTFTRFQRLWVEQMPAIPTVVPNILAGWKTRLGNVRPSVLMPHLMWNAEQLTVGKGAN